MLKTIKGYSPPLWIQVFLVAFGEYTATVEYFLVLK